MTQTFFDLNIRASTAFEATLRESVMQTGSTKPSWLWYLLAPLSLAIVGAFVFIPYLPDTLSFLLLDTLLII